MPALSSTCALRRPVSAEAALFAAISTADTFSTIWLVGRGIAMEANPLMRFYLERGVWVFVLVRLLMLAPVFVLESQSDRNPHRIRGYIRAATVLYLTAYALGMIAQLAALLR